MSSTRALVLLYDIRGFTAASRRLSTVDLGAFATAAHRTILDLFAARPPTFVKNLGDGHLLLWETTDPPEPALVEFVVEGAKRARTEFTAFVKGRDVAGATLPRRVGVGVAYGEVSRSDDYYGVALNLASRLQNLARPEGVALEKTVFETAGARDATLADVFKRARVKLKGLGSTLVWVDRPFSWARVLAPVAKVGGVVAAGILYASLCALDLPLPGGDAVRDAWDAVPLPFLRTVADERDVARSAQEIRRDLAKRLLDVQQPARWIAEKFDPPKEVELEVWSSSQAIAALMRCPETSTEQLRTCARGLAASFEGDLFVERGGVPYGFSPRAHGPYTEIEPDLWTAAALALALGRPGVVDEADRPRYLALLDRAQRAALTYRPLDTGAWNIFPNQKDLSRHSPYSTSLALLALLETKAARLPWAGDEGKRDALIRSTAAFIASTFLPTGSLPGWRRTGDPDDLVSLGLTLQDHALLLRAEAEAGVEVPAAILDEIPKRLSGLIGTSLEQQADAGEFALEFTTHAGVADSRTESINFLWHPWAVEAATRWLARDALHPGSKVVRRRVRRALGHLVVEMAPDVVAKASKGYIFVASETVYALSSVAPP